MEYLGMLYYARISGVFPQNATTLIGDTVNLEELAQFRDSFPVRVLRTEPGGAGVDQLRVWSSAGMLPDIYLTDAVASVGNEGLAADLTSITSGNALFSIDKVYPALVEGSKSNGRLFGIPMAFTVPMLFIDRTLADQYDIQTPSAAGWDVEMFMNETGKVLAERDLHGDTIPSPKEVVKTDAGLLSAKGLWAHLPSGLDSSLGWAAWTGRRFGFDRDAVLVAAEQIQVLTAAWITADRMADKDTEVPPADGKPVFSGNYVMHIGYSSQVSTERARLNDQLGLARLPYMGEERIGAHVYSLCIRPDAAKNRAIVDFAVFLALDPDALVLASRFDTLNGFMPVSKHDAVWTHLVANHMDGEFFQGFRSLLPTAYVDGATCVPGWSALYSALIQPTEYALVDGDLTASQAVDRLVSDS